MKINFNNEDNTSLIIAMEVGYQALADLADFYSIMNNELFEQLSIYKNKSIKEVKKEICRSLLIEDKEEEFLSKIKAAQEIIHQYNDILKEEN